MRAAVVVVLLLLLLALLSAGCAPAAIEIPQPPMAGAESVVVEAVEHDRAAVAADPADPAAWGRLGDRLRSQGWVRQAALCYQHGERLEPGNFRWPYLAAKSLRLEAPAESLAGFERALRLDENYAPAHLFLAQALVRTAAIDDAREHFRRATELDDTLAAAWLGLGQLALSEGRHEESLRLLQEALRRDAADGRIQLAASRAAAGLGRHEEAARYARFAAGELRQPVIPDPRAALHVEPVGSKRLAEHGRRLMAQRKLPEAIAALRESVRLDPDRAAPQVALGLALLIAGDGVAAEEHLRRALWLRPNLADAHAALGNLLLAEGRPRIGEALGHLTEAVRLRPLEPELRERLGAALALAGRDAEAAAERARAVAEARERLEVTLAPEPRRRLEELIRRLEGA